MSQYLVDTHIALWSLTDSPKLSKRGWALLSEIDAKLFVSAAVIWECAIKYRLNRGHADDIPYSGRTAIERLHLAGYKILPITAEHAAEVDHLPLHHRDPFDRLMIAQARIEPLRFLTHDKTLSAYGEFVVVV